MHLARTDGNFENMGCFHEYRQSACQIFTQIGDIEGQADTFFLWAIMLQFEKSTHATKVGSVNNLIDLLKLHGNDDLSKTGPFDGDESTLENNF